MIEPVAIKADSKGAFDTRGWEIIKRPHAFVGVNSARRRQKQAHHTPKTLEHRHSMLT